MSDIDFTTYEEGGSTYITLGTAPNQVTGNRALVNRFEITLLTSVKRFVDTTGKIITDNFGGNANRYVGTPHALYDTQSIAASMSIAIKKTVQSIQSDTPEATPNTERIDKAELIEINIVADVIYASIRIYPIEVEDFNSLIFNLPIKRV